MRDITFLIERYYTIQLHRIALGNQKFALEEANESTDTIEHFYQKFHELEKELYRYLSKEIKHHPVWKEYLKKVKGIGPVLASCLLSQIDIAKAEHASSVWKYCGLAVDLDTGKAERRTKGEKITWNPFLKKTCYLIGESFVKTKGKYRTIYDTSKEFYQRKFPNEMVMTDEKGKPVKTKEGGERKLYTKGHIHNMAKRRAVKLFLSELWAFWREKEGLPVSVPFMHRK